MLLICNCSLNYNQNSALRANFKSRELVGWARCLTSSNCKSLVCLFLFNAQAKKGLSLLWSRNTYVSYVSTSQVSLKPSTPVLATCALFTLWCLPSKTPHFRTSSGFTPSSRVYQALLLPKDPGALCPRGYTILSTRYWFFWFNFPKETMIVIIVLFYSTSVYWTPALNQTLSWILGRVAWAYKRELKELTF